MQIKTLTVAAVILLVTFFADDVTAADGHAIQNASDFELLKSVIYNGDADLDTYYAYAKAAEKSGNVSEAVAAYQMMLEENPSLDRVKLDLGLLLAKSNQLREARILFREVLDKPATPPQVRSNIQHVMQQLDEADKRHNFTGSLFTGFNYDTNASAVPNDELVLIQDQLRELNAPDERDGHVFLNASLSHQWKLYGDKTLQSKWISAVNVFETEQAKLPQLELRILGFKTGPTIQYMPAKVQFGMQVGYNRVELDGEEYLNLGTLGFRLLHQWTDKTQVTNNLVLENRRFVNSVTSPLLSLRSGHAVQNTLSLMHALTKKDILNSSIMLRRENTHEEFYDYDRYEVGISYTHLFAETLSGNINSRARWTNYDGPDSLITLSKTRNDYERIIAFSLTKQLPHNFLVNIGYQYNNVKSNLPNFDYSNHRLLTSLGWQF